MEYVDAASIQEEEQKAIKNFKLYSYREKSNVNLPLTNVRNTIESDNPIERILRRLNSYDLPKPPPLLNESKSNIPYLKFIDNESMFNELKPHFDVVISHAK